YAKADVETLRCVALDPEEVNHVECCFQHWFPERSGSFHGSLSSGKAHLWLRLSRADSNLAPLRRVLSAGRIGDTGVASIRRTELVGKETARKCGNATAPDHHRSSVHEVLVESWLSRVCARLDIECSEIDVCAKNAN